MPPKGPSMGRYDSSVEGWSAVDKVAQFSHAVGRVGGGRGSAILIALMDSQGQLIDPVTNPHPSRAGPSGRAAPPPQTQASTTESAPPRFNLRSAHDSFRSAVAGSVNSFEQNSRDDDPRRPRNGKQPPLGVLLTTSHVLCIPEEAEDATVTFLDQLGMMTAAVLGHSPKPMRVALRGAYGFVTSSAESNEHSTKYRRGKARHRSNEDSLGSRPQDTYRDEPDYLLYRNQDASDEDEIEDVGFTLTFCDIFPEPAEAASAAPSQPPTPLRRARGAASEAAAGSGGVSRGPSPQASSLRSSFHGRNLQNTLHSFTTNAEDGGSAQATRHSLSSGTGTAHTAASPSGGAASSTHNLLLVQPLPVPLILSAIPDVHVGDAHLMITHVNDGRRCYRVQHVSAVHPDYCEYLLASASEDECSGGAVFNSAGDFIGIQHERRGHGICLLMKSIVRNLFESDLLGMCRSPISEVSVKKREPQMRAGESQAGGGGGGTFSPRASFKRSVASSRINSLPATAAGTPRASAAATTTTTTGGGPHAAGAVANTNTFATSSSEPAPSVPVSRLPPSQQVPGFEAVFNEFYSGFDSVSHILYAFPYCRQLLKLALENLSQLKYGNELDQMSTIGGVGAILETIDGYPQDEAIVSGALAAMCRICIYERNLAMFLHLDGVVTTMEIMKEYVHQATVLQWGTYLLTSATDPSLASAAQCTETIVQSRGPQLLVNVLRVHGTVQRKSAVRHLQHNRLLRWTCDLMANLLAPDPKRTTLFLREDLLVLLLQLLHDYAGNMFLIEGLVHVFCVLVLCFSDLDGQSNPQMSDAQRVAQMLGSPEQRVLAPQGLPQAFLHPAEHYVSGQLRIGSAANGGASSFARGGVMAPHVAALDPHKVSFFFLSQAVAGDSESFFLRSLLEVCEAAMDPKSAVTAHRGRPEVVLLRCFETLRLLLSWQLVNLHHRGYGASRAEPGAGDSLTSLPESHTTLLATSSSLPLSTPSDELIRLRIIMETLRVNMPSCYELQAQLAAVEKLILQQK